MHEMGIAQQLAQIAIDALPVDLPEPKIKVINVKIGQLSAVVEHSLRTCFDIIAKETALEGAVLNIESVPVSIYCEKCDKIWEAQEAVFICPDCRNGNVRLETGRELQVVSIELEE